MKFICEVCTDFNQTSNYMGWLMHLSTSTHQKSLKFTVHPAFDITDCEHTYVLTGFTKPLLPHQRLMMLEYLSKYGVIIEFFHDSRYLFCYITFAPGSCESDILKEKSYNGTPIFVRLKTKLLKHHWDIIYDKNLKVCSQSQTGEDTSGNSNLKKSSSETPRGRGSRVFTSRILGRGCTSGSSHFGAKSSSRTDFTKKEAPGKGKPLQNKGEMSSRQQTKSAEVFALDGNEANICQIRTVLPNPEETQSVHQHQTALIPDEDKDLETTDDMGARKEEAGLNLEAVEEAKSKAEELPADHSSHTRDAQKDQDYNDDDGNKSYDSEMEKLTMTKEPATTEDHEKECHHNDSAIVTPHATENKGEFVQSESNKPDFTQFDQNTDTPYEIVGNTSIKQDSGDISITDVANSKHSSLCPSTNDEPLVFGANEARTCQMETVAPNLEVTTSVHETLVVASDGDKASETKVTDVLKNEALLNLLSDERSSQADLEQLTTDDCRPIGQLFVLDTAEGKKLRQREPLVAAAIPEASQSVPESTPDEEESAEDIEVLKEEAEVNFETDEASSNTYLEQTPGDNCTQILDGEQDQVCNYDKKPVPLSTFYVIEEDKFVVANAGTATFENVHTKVEEHEPRCHLNYSADMCVQRDEKEQKEDYLESVAEKSNKPTVSQIDENTWIILFPSGNIEIKF